jgi:hypothetical protein
VAESRFGWIIRVCNMGGGSHYYCDLFVPRFHSPCVRKLSGEVASWEFIYSPHVICPTSSRVDQISTKKQLQSKCSKA